MESPLSVLLFETRKALREHRPQPGPLLVGILIEPVVCGPTADIT